MAETPLDVRSSHRVEADGSRTVTIEMSGLPSLRLAQGVSDWVHKLIRQHAHEIGRLDSRPPGVQ